MPRNGNSLVAGQQVEGRRVDLRPLCGARPRHLSEERFSQLTKPSTVDEMSSAVVEAAADLAEIIEAHADEAEQSRRLPPSTVKALVDADLLRMCLPTTYGGPEVDPLSMVEAIVTNSGAEMPVCAWVSGQYDIDGVYLGVLAKLGSGGVVQVYEAPLTPTEVEGLREAAVAVKAKVADLEGIDY